MSGVTLPAIPGAVPLYTRSLPNGFDSSRSRPSSSGSQCSAYSIVPHVYYGKEPRGLFVWGFFFGGGDCFFGGFWGGVSGGWGFSFIYFYFLGFL